MLCSTSAKPQLKITQAGQKEPKPESAQTPMRKPFTTTYVRACTMNAVRATR